MYGKHYFGVKAAGAGRAGAHVRGPVDIPSGAAPEDGNGAREFGAFRRHGLIQQQPNCADFWGMAPLVVAFEFPLDTLKFRAGCEKIGDRADVERHRIV